MRILSLDVGEKRIGIARADTQTRIAIPVTTINCDGTEWQTVEKYTKLYDTTFFVLGLPRNNSGSETKQSLYVRNFAKQLVQKIPDAKIRFQDESLTSVIAEERLKQRKKSYEKGEIDAEAATIILQDFLESYHERLNDIPKTNTIEKTAKKAALETKKVKHKTKKLAQKLLVIPPIILIATLVVIGGGLWYKDYRAKERAAEYAKLEAEMTAEVFSFTILPGETIFDIKDSLTGAGYSESEVETALSKTYNYPMLKNRPAGASLEGFLYGETFEFYKTDSAEKIIETYLENFQNILDEYNFETAFNQHGLSLYEGIVLASIIQKEAAPADQPTVAQIFYSRLEYGWRLGSDVTVSYAKKIADPNNQICAADDNACAITLNSCYNTRINTGLPCGAISNPSLSALEAVANPSDTAYLYFLTGDDGIMYYSDTEAGHEANKIHCPILCNASL